VLVSILSRGGRFFLVGGTLYLFGDTFKEYLSKYFNIFTIVFIVLLLGGFYVFKIGLKRTQK
jgi:hypothetical protein